MFKVDYHAQDVPGGYRKGLRRELRSDLTAAAADLGMSQAVEDLGPASALALGRVAVGAVRLKEGRPLLTPFGGVEGVGLAKSRKRQHGKTEEDPSAHSMGSVPKII